MVAIVSALIFTGALATSLAVIAAMVLPQWHRIARLAAGHRQESFAPLKTLATAERRIAVRRWAATSAPMEGRLRAAA